MYSLSITFGPANGMWVFMYKDGEKASEVFRNITLQTEPEITIFVFDDFGQQAILRSTSIHAVMLEDLEQSKMAHIEQSLHRARMQARAQQMASGDAILRNAAAMSGPAVFQPGMGPGNGRFPQG
jgi:hypothetical protein